MPSINSSTAAYRDQTTLSKKQMAQQKHQMFSVSTRGRTGLNLPSDCEVLPGCPSAETGSNSGGLNVSLESLSDKDGPKPPLPPLHKHVQSEGSDLSDW